MAAAVADLDLHEVCKKFGKITALDKASIKIRKGTVHALLGENGAGKTTLMRIAFGLIAPDSGSISVRGQPVHFKSPADAIAARIGMVHQQFSLVPEMTIAENIALGGHGRYDRDAVARAVESIGSRMAMKLNPFVRVSTLTSSERQKVEIIRTLAHDATTLILDEPTAVLTPKDIGDLFAQLRALAGEGKSVVLITHKLRDALAHADEVTVLRQGRVVLNAPMTAVDENELAAAMLGAMQNAATSTSSSKATDKTQALRLTDITLRDERGIECLNNVSFQIAKGEIVGVAALEGAGRAMLRMIAGRLAPSAGEIARPERIGFVPEDRQDEAIIPALSLTENMALGNASSLSGRVHWLNVERDTAAIIAEYDVRALSAASSAASLSGGNQQKFVLGRELSRDSGLLVLENPTQGLDVHAGKAIHYRIRAAAAAGTAVIIYSSDLDELAELSDRVIVVSDRKISVTSADRDSIGKMLLDTAH